MPRVRALLGENAKFELEWVSIYTFSCLRMDKFRHGRVLFAGDSAHGVSPFGARGANSGIQDADNLAWKLKLVIDGQAPASLLDSYNDERVAAADENILNSTRSTDFITPKNEASRAFRDATLELARDCPFARRLVNSGRLSLPATYAASPLNTPDTEAFAGAMVPGAPAADAAITIGGWQGFFLNQLGPDFTLVHFTDGEAAPAAFEGPVAVRTVVVLPAGTKQQSTDHAMVEDAQGLLAQRYDARSGTTYLFRPDQHIAARFRKFDQAMITAALHRAIGKT
jgi:3-(3-hydroxy-phenyl)propionate hydroxylase